MQGSQVDTEEPVVSRHESHFGWYFQFVFVALVVAVVVVNSIQDRTSAYLLQRNVTITSSTPGAVTSHAYQFDILGTPSVGSIVFEYCINSPLPTVACIAPTGMDSAAAALTGQTGATGFTVHPNTALTPNKIVLTRAAALVSPGTLTYSFSTITNPTSSLGTTFVRIGTYPTADGSGVFDDFGAVTFSIQNPLTVSVYVPPFLTLCTGVIVDLDCSTSTGVTVDLGELSKTSPNTATTQFSVATNSSNGYAASMQGSTMTAGNRTIPPLTSGSPSLVGVSQFGINLRSNSSPGVGTDVVGAGTGVVSASYGTPNQFRFNSGDFIASSPISTEFNRYTISYLINVADGQAAGRYASTITVIATTTF